MDTTPSWKPQKRALKRLYKQAERLSGTPIEYYEGSRVTDRSQATLDSLKRRASLAGNDRLARSNAGMIADTVEGRYLNANPYLDETYRRAADATGTSFMRSVLPGLEARFRRAGGRSAEYDAARSNATGELADSLGGLANDVYGGNYQAERDRMLAAAGLAPSANALRYADTDQLAASGVAEDAYQQAKLTDEADRYERDANELWTRTAAYGNLIRGYPVFTRSTSETEGVNQIYEPSQYARDKDWLQITSGILGAL